MTVANILKVKGREVATASSTDPLSGIVRTLADKRIGAIVICDTPGEVAGIISERDIVRVLAESGASALSSPVSGFMTREVQTCKEADTAEHCMAVMTKGRFRHLPVITDGRLSGIISIGDIVKARIEHVEQEAEALRSYITTA